MDTSPVTADSVPQTKAKANKGVAGSRVANLGRETELHREAELGKEVKRGGVRQRNRQWQS